MEILDLNDLMYLQSVDLSAGISRQSIQRYPEKNSYRETEQIIFNLKNTKQFLDMKNSSLKFEFTLTADGIVELQTGSILNIFRRVRVLTPSGEQISHVDHLNVLQSKLLQVKHSQNFREVIGKSILRDKTTQGGLLVNNGAYVFTVPLRLLSPFFDNDTLIPPQLADGMRIEIDLERSKLIGAASTVGSFQVNNPFLMVDSYQMMPRVLTQTLEREELVYEYHDWQQAESSLSAGSNELAFPFNYSVSNALEAFAVLRTVSSQTSATADSFQTVGITVDDPDDQLLWRWGSVQLPHTRLIGSAQLYQNVLYCYDQLCSKTCDNFDLQIENESDLETFTTTGAIYPVNLRRSRLFENSGREISNRNNLEAQIRTHLSDSLVCDMFVHFVGRIVIKKDSMTVEK